MSMHAGDSVRLQKFMLCENVIDCCGSGQSAWLGNGMVV